MDNVKLYKKFATIFWWTLTILPLIVAVIYFIGYHLTFNSGIATASELVSYHSNSIGNFEFYLIDVLGNFSDFTMSSLISTFEGLFNILGVSGYIDLAILFAYMLSVQIYHLLFDCLVFFINMIHDFLDINKSRLF